MFSGIYPPANDGGNLIRYYNGKNIWYTSSQFSPQIQRNKSLISNGHLERLQASKFPAVKQDGDERYEESSMVNRGYMIKPDIYPNSDSQMFNYVESDFVKPINDMVNTNGQMVNDSEQEVDARDHMVNSKKQMISIESPKIRKKRYIHVDDMFTENDQSNSGTTITAHDIRYSVSVTSNRCFGRSQKKDIIKSVDCIFSPGLNTIMGPTGSGKTSLLDILAGRKNKENFSGKLLIEGLPPPDNFKCTVGYVAQNDALMGTLTVRENLEFSAALRLPSSVYNAERRKIVEHVINELGLHHCADAKVGNKFIPGVSGGERKRTCIGMELIISPKILFLDEPTTGLDANAASAVMLLLKGLALKGTTIVFTIYQPRYSIYRLLDHLTLLSRGETVYHGPAVNALDYFHNIGYDIQDHNNPADFFLDVINGDISTFYANNANKCEMLSDIAERLEKQDMDKVDELVHIKLVDGYKKSPIYSKLHDTLKKVLFDYEQNSREVTDLKQQRSGFTNGFIQRFGVIAAATLKNNLRNPMGFISQAAAMTIFACVVGAIYWQIQTDCKSGLQNRVGVFFLILMYLTLMNLSAIDLFISERPILVHESACRIHKVFSYFFAFIICDVIPNRLIPDVIFTVIAYFMIGFDKDVEKFFFFLLTIFLFSMAGAGVAYFFSSAFGPYANTNLVVAVVFVIMFVFGGFFVNTDSVPDWLEWIKWISIFRYGLKALVINELKNLKFNNSSGVQCGPSGNDYLKSQDIAYVTVWDKWQNIVALGVMSLLFFLLTFIVLLRVKKIK